MIPKFFLTELTDRYIRENFKKLQDYFSSTDPIYFKGNIFAPNLTGLLSGEVMGITQEFAWNSGNVTAAGASDLTSFGSGSQGTPLLAYNSTTGANSRTMFLCQFQNNFNPEVDLLFLEFQIQGTANIWLDSLNSGVGWTVQNNTFFGSVIFSGSVLPNQVEVWFGNGGYGPEGNSSYGNTGGLWSSLSGSWRLRKISLS